MPILPMLPMSAHARLASNRGRSLDADFIHLCRCCSIRPQVPTAKLNEMIIQSSSRPRISGLVWKIRMIISFNYSHSFTPVKWSFYFYLGP
jgi:hypothetical protein